MSSIIIICKFICDSWIPPLEAFGSDLGWALIFKPVLSVGMVMGGHVGSPLEDLFCMLRALAFGNYFVTWE